MPPQLSPHCCANTQPLPGRSAEEAVRLAFPGFFEPLNCQVAGARVPALPRGRAATARLCRPSLRRALTVMTLAKKRDSSARVYSAYQHPHELASLEMVSQPESGALIVRFPRHLWARSACPITVAHVPRCRLCVTHRLDLEHRPQLSTVHQLSLPRCFGCGKLLTCGLEAQQHAVASRWGTPGFMI